MKNKRLYYIAIFVLLVGLIFFVTRTTDERPKVISQGEISPSSAQIQQMSSATETVQPIVEPKLEQTSVHPFSNRLSKADDYRALSLELQTKPKNGGAYYATLINQRCVELLKTIDGIQLSEGNVPHAIASKRDHMIERMKAKCRNFTPTELSMDRLRELYKQRDKDSLLSATLSARNKNKTGAVICDDLSTLFETRSPEAISGAALYNGVNGVFFDKKTYGPIAYDALALAMCDLGADCSESNFFVQKNCVTHSICTDSAWDSMKQILDKSSKNASDDLRKLKMLSQQMAMAIRNNEVQKFSPIQCK